jgi:hypothetical protein
MAFSSIFIELDLLIAMTKGQKAWFKNISRNINKTNAGLKLFGQSFIKKCRERIKLICYWQKIEKR